MTLSNRNPFRQTVKNSYRYVHRLFGSNDHLKAKVFGIGLSRTGTKSLNQALKILGYASDHFSTHLLKLNKGELTFNFDAVNDYDALTDVTASLFYQGLDNHFPGSRFILTVRSERSWLGSCERHFPPLRKNEWPYGSKKILQLRDSLYGTTEFDQEKYLHTYMAHLDEVQRYFMDRPKDLLIYDVTAGMGWEPLCQFLNLAEPKQSFPWANRTWV